MSYRCRRKEKRAREIMRNWSGNKKKMKTEGKVNKHENKKRNDGQYEHFFYWLLVFGLLNDLLCCWFFFYIWIVILVVSIIYWSSRHEEACYISLKNILSSVTKWFYFVGRKGALYNLGMILFILIIFVEYILSFS